MSRLMLSFVSVALAALVPGCGKTKPPPIVEAEGTVLLNGKPLPHAEVRFVPMAEIGAEYIASATTDAEGKFRLECNGKSGGCSGENYVTVAEPEVPKEMQGENKQRELAAYMKSLANRPIPRKYANLNESPLRITLSPGQKDYPIEMNR